MAFILKIQLNNVSNPTVWRRVIVPETLTFLEFHKVIQCDFPWDSCHLFQFSPTAYGPEPVIGIPEGSSASNDNIIDAKTLQIGDIFTEEGQTYTYVYDFGDDWEHTIVLEQITHTQITTPDCLDGKGQCPPEDCGGPLGYERLKTILANPKDPEGDEIREWLDMEVDEEWDVHFFHLDTLRVLVQEALLDDPFND